MTQFLEDIKENIKENMNAILLGGYLFVVLSIYIFVNLYGNINGSEKLSRILVLSLIGSIAFLIFLVVPCILRVLRSIQPKTKEITCKQKIIYYLVFTVVSFLVFFLWYLAYNPGAFSSDSITQYTQAINEEYIDWHPAWHTMMIFKVPLMITGEASSIVLFQIIYFSLVLGYMALVICEYAEVKYAIIALAYILLNPFTGAIAMFPWKDVAFSVTGLWVMICVAKIYFTNGKWSAKKGRTVLLAWILVNATLFRQNAILFTAVILVALFFYLDRKKWFQLLIGFCAFFILIKGPVYSIMGVESKEAPLTELVGMPLTIIANVTKECPEMLDEETAAFVYAIAPQEKWEMEYTCGDFNSIKWNGIDTSIVEETGIVDILKMTVRCFTVAPEASFKALFSLTDVVYAVEGEIEGFPALHIKENDFGIELKGNEDIRILLQRYRSFYSKTIFKYFGHIGMSMLIMLAFILAKSNLGRKADWKKIGLCMPIFVYNFGTMLLLTGPDARYFFISFLVCPIVVLMTMRKERQ